MRYTTYAVLESDPLFVPAFDVPPPLPVVVGKGLMLDVPVPPKVKETVATEVPSTASAVDTLINIVSQRRIHRIRSTHDVVGAWSAAGVVAAASVGLAVATVSLTKVCVANAVARGSSVEDEDGDWRSAPTSSVCVSRRFGCR